MNPAANQAGKREDQAKQRARARSKARKTLGRHLQNTEAARGWSGTSRQGMGDGRHVRWVGADPMWSGAGAQEGRLRPPSWLLGAAQTTREWQGAGHTDKAPGVTQAVCRTQRPAGQLQR